MKRTIFFTIILLTFVVIQTKGQFNYKPGKVITTNNDTLIGYINDGGYIRNSNFCIYKKSKKEEKVKYFPKDIKSFIIDGENYYSSQKIPNEKNEQTYFVEVLLEGKVNLYYSRRNKELSYFVQKDGGELVGLSKESVILAPEGKAASSYWNQQAITVHINSYKDTLKSLFRDCNLIQDQIQGLEYKQEPLQNIAKTYAGLTSSDKNKITYEQDLKSRKFNFGLFAGMQLSRISFPNSSLKSDLHPANSNSFLFGIFYNRPIYAISDRFSFQTELIFSKTSYSPEFITISNNEAYTDIRSNTFSIPLFIKYEFNTKYIVPTIGLGKEAGFSYNSRFQYIRKTATPEAEIGDIYAGVDYLTHWMQKGGWFFDIGLKYEINKKKSVFLSYRYQQRQSLVIENKYNQYLTYSALKKKNLGASCLHDITYIRIGMSF